MKEIKVRIRGTGEGLLMHSAQGMLTQKVGSKNPTKNYDPVEEAENVAYRNKKGELIIPSRCLKACFLNASSFYKIGKRSAKPILAGTTRIEPSEITLLDSKGKPLKDYEIDLRPVVVQRARIIRARPIVKVWEADFSIIYDDKMVGQDGLDIFKEILEDSGKRIGLLDNRPQKYGENGTFEVLVWKAKK